MTHDKPGSNSFRRSQLSATAQHCHLLPKCLLYTRSGAREPLILLEGKPEKECANVSFTCLCHLFNFVQSGESSLYLWSTSIVRVDKAQYQGPFKKIKNCAKPYD